MDSSLETEEAAALPGECLSVHDGSAMIDKTIIVHQANTLHTYPHHSTLLEHHHLMRSLPPSGSARAQASLSEEDPAIPDLNDLMTSYLMDGSSRDTARAVRAPSSPKLKNKTYVDDQPILVFDMEL